MDRQERILRRQVTVAVGAGDTELLGVRPGRVGLVITPPKQFPIVVSFDSPAAVGNGIRIAPGTQPFVLHGWHLLGALGEDVRVCCDGGTEQVTAVEMFF